MRLRRIIDSVNDTQHPAGGPLPPTPEKSEALPRIGWREWVGFPEWGIPHIKAKVDTGARTSSLHVEDLEWFDRAGSRWVRFSVRPWQRSSKDVVIAETKVQNTRDIKSSSGTVDRRPVIQVRISVASHTFGAELTLTNRDAMGFRMLLGREAIRRRFVVDPGTSYVGGRPAAQFRRRNRGKA